MTHGVIEVEQADLLGYLCYTCARVRPRISDFLRYPPVAPLPPGT